MLEIYKKILDNRDFLNNNNKCNEENTKNCMIIPFLEKVFKIDFSNPDQVLAEDQVKNMGRCDYIINFANRQVIIECKSYNIKLNDNSYEEQLKKYCFDKGLNNVVGILTNGIEYKFYKFKVSKNKIELNNILELSIETIYNVEVKNTNLSIKQKRDYYDNLVKLEDIKTEMGINDKLEPTNNISNQSSKPIIIDNSKSFNLFDNNIFNMKQPKGFYFKQQKIKIDKSTWNELVRKIYDILIENYRDKFISSIIDNNEITFVSKEDKFGDLNKYFYNSNKITCYICTNYDPKQHTKNLRKVIKELNLDEDCIKVLF